MQSKYRVFKFFGKKKTLLTVDCSEIFKNIKTALYILARLGDTLKNKILITKVLSVQQFKNIFQQVLILVTEEISDISNYIFD